MCNVPAIFPKGWFDMYSYADACVVARFQSLDKECATHVIAHVWPSTDDETPPALLLNGYTVTETKDLYVGAVPVAAFRNGSRVE